MLRRRVSILGATGSIGASTVSVIEELQRNGDAEIEVEALTGGSNVQVKNRCQFTIPNSVIK